MEIIIIIIIIIKQGIEIRFLGVILSVEVEKRGTRKSWRKDDTGELPSEPSRKSRAEIRAAIDLR